WEGDTLVVETKGFNGEAWMDQMGRPTTESTRVIERFHRKDYGHMDLQITVDDPKLYTKAWTVNQGVRLAEPGLELMEYGCVDRDLSHLPGNGRPVPLKPQPKNCRPPVGGHRPPLQPLTRQLEIPCHRPKVVRQKFASL